MKEEEWHPFSWLCKRWKTSEYTVAKLVIDGKLRSYDVDYMEICVIDNGFYKQTPEDHGSIISRPLTVAEVTEFIFRKSDVEAFEKKNGIIPLVHQTDSGDPTARMTTPDSTSNKEQTDKVCTPSEKDSESFIRSLQVSYIDNTEVKIQYKGKRMNYTCESIGFRDIGQKHGRLFLKSLIKRSFL